MQPVFRSFIICNLKAFNLVFLISVFSATGSSRSYILSLQQEGSLDFKVKNLHVFFCL